MRPFPADPGSMIKGVRQRQMRASFQIYADFATPE